MVDEDLKRLFVQDVLLQYNEGDAAERRKLTSNLCALRKAERDLRDVLYSRKKAFSRHMEQHNTSARLVSKVLAVLLQIRPIPAWHGPSDRMWAREHLRIEIEN
jgi:hypothetical protein